MSDLVQDEMYLYNRGNELDFRGKTALVTGSARNIGRAVVLEFALRGANVIINTMSNIAEATAVEREAHSLGAETLVVMGDVSQLGTIEEMKKRAEERFGRVDIYVSNAARRFSRAFFETTNDDWSYFLNQQLTASWYLAKAFVPGMVEAGWGRIIHINGGDGWGGGWTRIPHSTAKGALRTLTKSLAIGLGEHGITVNDITPGRNDTVRDPLQHPRTSDPLFLDELRKGIPIHRLTTPAEAAWACSFLCSPRSGFLNGMVVHCDGGNNMRG